MCKHEDFEASVKVHRIIKNGDLDYLAVDVEVHCVECEKRVRFRGMNVGVTPAHPTVRMDHGEARLPADI